PQTGGDRRIVDLHRQRTVEIHLDDSARMRGQKVAVPRRWVEDGLVKTLLRLPIRCSSSPSSSALLPEEGQLFLPHRGPASDDGAVGLGNAPRPGSPDPDPKASPGNEVLTAAQSLPTPPSSQGTSVPESGLPIFRHLPRRTGPCDPSAQLKNAQE